MPASAPEPSQNKRPVGSKSLADFVGTLRIAPFPGASAAEPDFRDLVVCLTPQFCRLFRCQAMEDPYHQECTSSWRSGTSPPRPATGLFRCFDPRLQPRLSPGSRVSDRIRVVNWSENLRYTFNVAQMLACSCRRLPGHLSHWPPAPPPAAG